MNTLRISLLSLLVASASAFAGDEVRNGRTVEKDGAEKEEQFCMVDPSTNEEVCVAKDKKSELEKKLKAKQAPAAKE